MMSIRVEEAVIRCRVAVEPEAREGTDELIRGNYLQCRSSGFSARHPMQR